MSIIVKGRFMPIRQKNSSYRGAYRVPLFNLSVGLYVPVCVTFVIFTDSESYTRPTYINPGPVETGEGRPTHGTCFIARRLEVDPVAGLL